jgi:ATP-dependent Clp protease ATP-binding subunit ClpC
MTHARSEAELVTLRKIAHELAASRKERLTTVHLLAAIASRSGPAAELLHERRLDQDALLKASRSFDEEGADPVGRAMNTARDLATRSPAPEPNGLHLLLALLADRRAAAHRALLQSGVDVARLRSSAMQLALGVVSARRTLAASQRARPEEPPERARPSAVTGVAVPLFPPSRPSSPPPAPAQVVPLTPARSEPGRQPVTRPRGTRRGASSPRRPNAPARAKLEAVTKPASANEEVDASLRARRAIGAEEARRFALDPKQFPTLTSLGHNLTLAAAMGELEEVIGREIEMDRALDVLAKKSANSPCLVGPPGVGKTAVARGLAHRFAKSPDGEEHVLVEIAVAELVAGAAARGALGERLGAIRTEMRQAEGRVVLFMDEVHELFTSSGADEAAGELKIALARGELPLIAATTGEEYRRAIESDPILARRFSPIEIEEPDEEDAFLLLQSVASSLGRHHDLAYSDESIATAVSWSIRYLPGRALPDKAVAVLDLAGARTRRRAGRSARTLTITPAEVAGVVAELADLPVERLLETDRERMLGLETLFAEKVVGHRAALARIATILRRNAAGLRGRRPIGSFLLLGPTGVGKTETAKAIAEALFHSPDAMTRLDLSEYAEAHAIARLVGAPPGYVGFEAGGQLTETVRRRPYQVILLDEIEKAHRDVLEAFLQVFDEGRLTDGRGRRVDFTNTVIVLTSNLGAAEAGAVRAEKAVGFSRSRPVAIEHAKMADAMLGAARASLPPELYNRIDEVLCYSPLSRADVAEIARRLLAGLGESLASRGVRLDVEPAAIDALLDGGGFDVELGARPMKRAIARLIEAPLAEMILRGELESGAVALVGVEDGAIAVDAVKSAAKSTAWGA